MRGERHRPVRFPRPVRDNARAEQTHADLTTLWTNGEHTHTWLRWVSACPRRLKGNTVNGVRETYGRQRVEEDTWPWRAGQPLLSTPCGVGIIRVTVIHRFHLRLLTVGP
jgi:hypothetical protein